MILQACQVASHALSCSYPAMRSPSYAAEHNGFHCFSMIKKSACFRFFQTIIKDLNTANKFAISLNKIQGKHYVK